MYYTPKKIYVDHKQPNYKKYKVNVPKIRTILSSQPILISFDISKIQQRKRNKKNKKKQKHRQQWDSI